MPLVAGGGFYGEATQTLQVQDVLQAGLVDVIVSSGEKNDILTVCGHRANKKTVHNNS